MVSSPERNSESQEPPSVRVSSEAPTSQASSPEATINGYRELRDDAQRAQDHLSKSDSQVLPTGVLEDLGDSPQTVNSAQAAEFLAASKSDGMSSQAQSLLQKAAAILLGQKSRQPEPFDSSDKLAKPGNLEKTSHQDSQDGSIPPDSPRSSTPERGGGSAEATVSDAIFPPSDAPSLQRPGGSSLPVEKSGSANSGAQAVNGQGIAGRAALSRSAIAKSAGGKAAVLVEGLPIVSGSVSRPLDLVVGETAAACQSGMQATSQAVLGDLTLPKSTKQQSMESTTQTSSNEDDPHRQAALDGGNRKSKERGSSNPSLDNLDRLEATAIDIGTLNELITDMKSGQISRRQSVDLESKHIACSIAQGAPLQNNRPGKGQAMHLPGPEKLNMRVKDWRESPPESAAKEVPKQRIRNLTAMLKDIEGRSMKGFEAAFGRESNHNLPSPPSPELQLKLGVRHCRSTCQPGCSY